MNALYSALSQAGIPFDGHFVVDGEIHRYKTNGDHADNCWYALHQLGDVIVGAYGCWKRGFVKDFCNVKPESISPENRKELRQAVEQMHRARKAEEEKNHERVRERCARIFKNPGISGHGYLDKKGIAPRGTLAMADDEAHKGWLAIPLQDESGIIHTAEFISPQGDKYFLYQGDKRGHFCLLPGRDNGPLAICEGYATGVSIQMATGWEVACAMDCGNLLEVCNRLRTKYPHRIMVVCADNDQFTENNPGYTKGQTASTKTHSTLCYPTFPPDSLIEKPTDFNDVHEILGLAEVERQITSFFPIRAVSVGRLQRPVDNDPNELLRHRYLSIGGGLLINGPTGMGKSSFLMQAAACWANGKDFFGIHPTRPLSMIIVQAENDEGDMAEMRDGICCGLDFTEDQRTAFHDRVHTWQSTGLTGKRFCQEVLIPLLSIHQYDILAIDPAFSFLGGDAKESKDVSEFLRTYLNPILLQYRCACIILHHTNKPPTGKEKNSWRNGDWAYAGSGTIEWANWARAIISMQSTGTHGRYVLHLGKRGSRLRWSNDEGQSIGHIPIEWSKSHSGICWHMGNPDPDSDEQPKSNAGRPPKVPAEKLLDLVADRSLSSEELAAAATETFHIARATVFRYLRLLESQNLISQDPISNRWRKHLQDQTEFSTQD